MRSIALFLMTVYNQFIFYCFAVSAVVILSIPFFLIGLFSKTPFIYTQKIAKPCMQLCAVCMPVLKNIYFENKYNVKDGVIYVCNHQSSLDMVVLLSRLSGFVIVAKSYLKYVPFLNICIKILGGFFLGNGNLEKLFRLRKVLDTAFEANASVLVFPEGTRSLTDGIEPFHNGAFRFAKDFSRPIVPIVIYGTRLLKMKGKLSIERFSGDVYVSVLEPVFFSDFSDTESYCTHVRDIMQKEYLRLKGVYNEKT